MPQALEKSKSFKDVIDDIYSDSIEKKVIAPLKLPLQWSKALRLDNKLRAKEIAQILEVSMYYIYGS